MNRLKKLGFRVPISSEVLYGAVAMEYMMRGGQYARIIESEETIEPTDEQWRQYYKAKKMWKRLRKNPYFFEGGNDYPNEVRKPEPERIVRYAETREEWLSRCQQIDADMSA